MDVNNKATGATPLEQVYPGMDDKHTFNSAGKFVHTRVRKVEDALCKIKRAKARKAHKQRNVGQTSVYERRITLLKKHGDFKKATTQLELQTFTNREGQLRMEPDPEMQECINGIKSIANDTHADQKVSSRKVIISADKLKKRAQKDLAIFFAESIKSARSPHTLCHLNYHIETELRTNAITERQAHKLREGLQGKCQVMARALPQTLESMTPDTYVTDPNIRHDAETRKLQYVHELTMTLQGLAPDLVHRHRKSLRDGAMAAFTTGTNYLAPDQKNLEVTNRQLEAVTENREALLKPVLEKVSKQSESKLRTATRNTEAVVNAMKEQLEEIPKLQGLQKQLLEDMTNRQEALGRVTMAVRTNVADLQKHQESYENLKKNANTTKTMRRLNPSYQRKRAAVKKEIRQAEAKRNIAQQSGKDQLDQFRACRNQYANYQTQVDELKQQYGSSIKVLNLSPDTRFEHIEGSVLKGELDSLYSQGLIEEVDVVSTCNYFDNLAKKG